MNRRCRRDTFVHVRAGQSSSVRLCVLMPYPTMCTRQRHYCYFAWLLHVLVLPRKDLVVCWVVMRAP